MGGFVRAHLGPETKADEEGRIALMKNGWHAPSHEIPAFAGMTAMEMEVVSIKQTNNNISPAA